MIRCREQPAFGVLVGPDHTDKLRSAIKPGQPK
jgi:hypothetical protein